MESDILYNSLLEVGLDELGAKIYIGLLKLKNPTITELARQFGVERLTIYRAIDKLEKTGLLDKKEDYSRNIKLESPSKVLAMLKRKQSVAKHLSDNLATFLPDLLAEYHQTGRQPKVRFYESRESFMALLDESVNEAEGELYFLGSPEILNFVPEYMQIYISNRKKKQIISHSISFRNPTLATHSHKEELRELKWLPAKFNVPAAYLAYGNKVAIWNTALPKIILIEDKVIFEFFKAIHSILWESDATSER